MCRRRREDAEQLVPVGGGEIKMPLPQHLPRSRWVHVESGDVWWLRCHNDPVESAGCRREGDRAIAEIDQLGQLGVQGFQ